MVHLTTHETGHGTRRALLLHGINGDAGVWWRFSPALAELGFSVTTVDLRGHGSSPRARSYRMQDYADDLPGGWDLVVGHSLGGVIATVAASRGGFAHRLLLIEPVLELGAHEHNLVAADQLAELEASEAAVAAAHPLWDPRDVAAAHAAAGRADRGAVESTFAHNRPWSFSALARALTVPTTIVAGDPEVVTMSPASHVADSPAITHEVVPGSGHSPHRDRPERVLAIVGRDARIAPNVG
jgi:pimeloyl-ACP methyl ester carboxylesterase